MDAVLDSILAWAEAEEAVRLVVLTSTRARPEGPPDELSDYDVIVALTDLDRFDPAAAYRTPAARWGDEHDVHGTTTFFRGVVYEDCVKIDWTLWPANVPALIAEHGLNDNLDVGYRVLLDKDGAVARWPQPTFRAHIPARPSEEEYVALVEEFWWSATYIAKGRARGEEFFARFIPTYDVTDVLRRMLEWKIELRHGWSWKPGAYGRGIERELPGADADELLASTGSLERMTAMFRRVANEVGDALGYAYPQYADDAVSAYVARLAPVLRDVRETDLPVFFEYEHDRDAAAMAGFPARERDAFMAHWAKTLASETARTWTIVCDGEPAGNIGCWEDAGRRYVGYWIGREFWGRGLATRALSQVAAIVDERPLHAHVVKSNGGSIRVLEKCGFVPIDEHAGDDGVVELLFELR